MQDFVFPANAAYPTGGPGAGRHIVMEMHYDNPNMEEGDMSMKPHNKNS